MKIDLSQFSAISAMLERRRSMQQIRVKDPSSQEPGSSDALFRLFRAGEGNYYLENITDKSQIIVPDGIYLFAITVDEPTTIFCGAPFCAPGAYRHACIEGHTSLTMRSPVYYAGEMYFSNGNLTKWTNGSGHYRPPGRLSSNNILPPVRLMLPERLFVDYF